MRVDINQFRVNHNNKLREKVNIPNDIPPRQSRRMAMQNQATIETKESALQEHCRRLFKSGLTVDEIAQKTFETNCKGITNSEKQLRWKLHIADLLGVR